MLNKKPGMPRIIPLPGASTVARVMENSKEVFLNVDEMALIDEGLARLPVQGQRYPDMLEQFADN